MWQGLGFSRAALGEISGIVECPCDTTLIQLVVNNRDLFHVLVDEGCQCYAAISEKVVEDLKIPSFPSSLAALKDPPLQRRRPQ